MKKAVTLIGVLWGTISLGSFIGLISVAFNHH